MQTSSRWFLLAVILMTLAVFVVCSPQTSWMVRAAEPSKEVGKSLTVTVYDPDPKHLWNRLHAALCERLEGETIKELGQLDPFQWDQSPYRETSQRYKREQGENYKRAITVLDEFIAEKGDTLINDPRKRALLQRDLWALFDQVTVPASKVLVRKGKLGNEMELARRVAQILPRLALSAEQLKALPDNYTEAVKAKIFPEWFEASQFWDDDGPWVLLGSEEGTPLARTHVDFFDGRSAFFVFIRLPEGREQTVKFIAEVASKKSEPVLPQGGLVALVRQMQLIDDRGRIVLTPVVESLQVRGSGEHEFKLNRDAFIAGKPSLMMLDEESKERSYIVRMGHNAGHERAKVLDTCFHCHQQGRIQSAVREFPPLQSIRPKITPSKRDDEAMRASFWKFNRYEWGLLKGLTLSTMQE